MSKPPGPLTEKGTTVTEARPTTDAREALFALLPAVFRECCDAFAVRYDLSTPFLQAGQVYATDGRIAVRCPATPEREAACAAVPVVNEGPNFKFDRKRPNVAEFFFGLPPADPTPVPAPDTSCLKVCPVCKGVDKVPETPDDWEDWDEDGLCHVCGGTHIEDNWDHTFPLGRGAAIGAVYAQKLDRHGATLFLAAADPHKSPIRFTLPGGVEGVVMPVTRHAHGWPEGETR